MEGGAVRRRRFDFALVAARVAIELEGGTFTNGAHVRGKHFASDCEKYNAAVAQGWRVFRLTRAMIGRKQLMQIKTFLTAETRWHAERAEKGPLPGWQG